MESEASLRAILETAVDAIAVIDEEGTVQAVNRSFEALFGYTNSEAIGRDVAVLMPGADAKRHASYVSAYKASGLGKIIGVGRQVHGRRADGTEFPLDLSIAEWRDEQGQRFFTGIMRDVTARVEAEKALLESEEKLSLAIQATGLGIWDHDERSGAHDWSPKLREILGVLPNAAAGLDEFFSLVHPGDRGVARTLLGQKWPGHSFSFEEPLRVLRACDGKLIWITVDGLSNSSWSKRAKRTVVAIRDVTLQKTAADQVKWAAEHNPLTGLPTRRLFQTQLDRALTERKQDESSAVVLAAIDRLDEVAASLGQGAVDALITSTAAKLRTTLPQGAVAHLSDDVFAAILPASSRSVLDACLLKLTDALAGHALFDGRAIECTVSLGVALMTEHGATAELLLRHADIALRSCRTQGRGQATFFEPALAQAVDQHRRMLVSAKDALLEGRVQAFYQPKIDIERGTIVGFEALLRWQDRQGRTRAPAELASALEDSQLGPLITANMLESVMCDAEHWTRAGISFGQISVNVCSADFRQPDFVARLTGLLERHSFPTSSLQLEITETVLLDNREDSIAPALQRLSEAGVSIALDDFGTGYASLSHLKKLHVDAIKIDQSFVRGMLQDAGHREIVRAVTALGKALGKSVVAEGVETARVLAELQTIGCSSVQGYFFARPMPAAEVIPFVKAFKAVPSAGQAVQTAAA